MKFSILHLCSEFFKLHGPFSKPASVASLGRWRIHPWHSSHAVSSIMGGSLTFSNGLSMQFKGEDSREQWWMTPTRDSTHYGTTELSSWQTSFFALHLLASLCSFAKAGSVNLSNFSSRLHLHIVSSIAFLFASLCTVVPSRLARYHMPAWVSGSQIKFGGSFSPYGHRAVWLLVSY